MLHDSDTLFDGARVRVRSFRPTDEASFVELVTDPVATAAMGGPVENPHALFARIASAPSPGRAAWVVVERSTEQYVGHVFIRPSSLPQGVELGFVLVPRVWGQGFASEAVTGVVEALRRADPDLSLGATVDLENVASQRLLTRLGFRLESQEVDEDGPYLVYALGGATGAP